MEHLHTRNRDARRAALAGVTPLDAVGTVCRGNAQPTNGFRRPEARNGFLFS